MKRYWFKRKTYGWGWTSATWEGWVVLLVWAVILVFLFKDIDEKSYSSSNMLTSVVVPFVISLVILLAVCFWKGEKPKWQWGEKTDQEK